MNKSIVYEDYICKLIKRIIPLQDRFKVIKFVNDIYFEDRGENLPNPLINKCTGWCLREMYSDRSTDKATKEEYPVLSIHQYKRRLARQVFFEDHNSIEILNYHKKNNNLHYNKKGVSIDE